MRLPTLSLSDRGLQFKLTMVMFILFACSVGSVFIPYYAGRESLKRDLEESFLELSNAIRVSVDQLTDPGATDEDRLNRYVESLKKKGIKEVSIVGEDMGIIDSTNPRAIGKFSRVKLPAEKLVINATFGDVTREGKLPARDLVIPVTVGGDTLGYIHVQMRIDDFTEVIRKNLYLRFFSTLLIFSIGLILSVGIAARYVRPVEELAVAAERVAAGDLSQELPVRGGDEVGRLTRAFNEMIVRLRQNRELEEKMRQTQALTQLGRLASGVAHEIRNPLNFIGLAVDRLDDLTLGRTPEACREKQEIISRIREEIGRLNSLVVDFITYGRPQEPQRSPVHPAEIVEGVLLMADGRLRSQGVVLSCDLHAGPPVLADPDMLRRAVTNVVANALDAMPAGGTLRAFAGPRRDGTYAIEIEDTGTGIREEDLGKVFEPYFTTKTSGLGLGLGLTRRIVEAHGGEIRIASEKGKGTRVTILLPAHGEGAA